MLTGEDLKKDIEKDIQKRSKFYTKVETMFLLQHQLNTLIKDRWYEDESMDFQRAAMIELGELMDHYGYKWWKKQTPDVDQCKLEVVDIAHFVISHLIQDDLRNNKGYNHSVELFAGGIDEAYGLSYSLHPEGIRSLLDKLIGMAAEKDFDSIALGSLMVMFDINFDELSDKYILKNTLNIFRNKNGYNEGTYIKNWNGKEDNEVLMEIYEKLDHSREDFATQLYLELDRAYQVVKP